MLKNHFSKSFAFLLFSYIWFFFMMCMAPPITLLKSTTYFILIQLLKFKDHPH